MRRKAHSLFPVLVALAMVALALTSAHEAAAAETCRTSGPGGYTVEVCLQEPADGATVSGPVPVTATVAVVGGSSGVARVVFYLDSEHLIADYEAPYTFVLPSDSFADGPRRLEAEAVLRDGFTTSRTPVTLDFSNGLATQPTIPTGFAPTSGTMPAAGKPPVVVATGDGAGGRAGADAVVETVASLNPNAFIYLGDVYAKGTFTEFKNWYGDGERFGRFASITNPVVGNHEYEDGAAPGYERFWRSPSPYYSYDVGGWHFIALNSTTQLGQVQPGTPQYEWLAQDLASSSAACTAVSFHHPVLSVGPQGDTPRLTDLWRLMATNGVDVILTGHDHNYQRWTPMDRDLAAAPGGMTQFVLGAGGHGVQGFVRQDDRLAVGLDTVPDALGALKLELNEHGAAFEYRNTAGVTRDEGTIACSGAGQDVTPPSVPSDLAATPQADASVRLTWSAAQDNVGVDSYVVRRDGAVVGTVSGTQLSYRDTSVLPSTAYSYTVEARDAAGNGSGPTPPVQVTTPAPPTELTFVPVADAYVSGDSPGTNYGLATVLRVDTSPDLRSYLRFEVSGVSGVVRSAKLRVFSNSSHSQGYEVRGSENGWAERGVTYADAPVVGDVVGRSGAAVAGSFNEVDVTSLVGGNGLSSFALTGLNSTAMSMGSRESSSPPELVVTQDTSGRSAPVAADVRVATSEDTRAVWVPEVSDADSDGLTCSIVTAPDRGHAAVEEDCASGSYVPDPDFWGTDSFEYAVSDGTFVDTGVVTVEVESVNDAPTVAGQSVTAAAGSPVTVTLSGVDVDGDCPLSFEVVRGPLHGSLGPVGHVECSAGQAGARIDYTPDPGYTGTDSFTVTAVDPAGASSPPAEVSIIVEAPPTEFRVLPSADAYVSASSPGSNYGTAKQLRLDGSPIMRSYLSFDVPQLPGPVTSAKLRLYANSKHTMGLRVSATAVGWGERTITYANAPDVGVELGASGPLSVGTYVEVDVTPSVAGSGQVAFVLVPLNDVALNVASRETNNHPELVITSGP